MLLKTLKNSVRLFQPVLFALLLASFVLPSFGHAYTFQQPVTLSPVNAAGQVVPDPKTGLINICPSTDPANPKKGFTSRLMMCVRDTLLYSTYKFYTPFSLYLRSAIVAACTLALALWGVAVAMGKQGSLSRDGGILAIKISLVLLFTANFAGFFPIMLNVLEDMVNGISKAGGQFLDTKGCTVWDRTGSSEMYSLAIWDLVDCMVERLIGGIFSPFTISFSLLGLLVGAMFSSPVGFFIAMIGFYLIAITLFAIARSLYIFITAYIAFSLMVMISPIFIPMALFNYTRGTFEKWLKLTVGFLLQPLFLFAFMIMFLAAFHISVVSGPRSLYRAVAGVEVGANPGEFRMGKWLQETLIYTEKNLQEEYVNVDPLGKLKKTGVPGNLHGGTAGDQQQIPISGQDLKGGIDNKLGVGKSGNTTDNKLLNFFKIKIPVASVDWKKLAKKANPSGYMAAEYSGSDELNAFYKNYLINVFISFVMAMLTMYIFFSMLEYLPFIGSNISGGGMNMPIFGAGKLAPMGASKLGVGGR